MRLKSHVLVADRTLEIIEHMTGLKFNRKLVRLGAILPDIHPYRRVQLHTPGIVAQQYIKEFKRIVLKEKKMNRISLIIGLLSHYIADAFTLAHNIYNSKIKKHVKYEHLLDDLKHNVPYGFKSMLTSVEGQIESIKGNVNDISSYLNKMNKKYMKKVKNLHWKTNIQYDIQQAIIHGATIIVSFIKALQKIKIPAFS